MRRLFLSAAWLALLPAIAAAESQSLTLTVAAGKHDRKNEPVVVPLTLPKALTASKIVVMTTQKGQMLLGQLTAPSLNAPAGDTPAGKERSELHFILPELKAGESMTLSTSFDSKKAVVAKNDHTFAWVNKPNEYSELSFGKRPVLRYIDIPLDESTPAQREATFKVYHHLYTPDGSRLATKGVGGLYTHHRGIFYGFMKVTYDDNKVVDIWHCKEQTYQGHEKILSEEAGPVLGRHRLLIGWHGKNKELFAKEERELTVYNTPGGELVEFASRLTPVKGTVKVDGDPQHAGFHFRADEEVNKNKMQTVYIRPDGIGVPGAERNWDPKTQKGPVDLPWNAMSFVLGDKRYTAAYLDRPDNPKEARYSERNYGRFGSYFVAEATEKNPLTVNYRLWLQEGYMKGPEVAALDEAFVEPATVTVK
jgi:hypothetical protein